MQIAFNYKGVTNYTFDHTLKQLAPICLQDLTENLEIRAKSI